MRTVSISAAEHAFRDALHALELARTDWLRDKCLATERRLSRARHARAVAIERLAFARRLERAERGAA